MQKIISLVFKAVRKIWRLVKSPYSTPFAYVILYLNNVKTGRGLKVNGLLKVNITLKGDFIIGRNVSMNSGNNHNLIGRQQKCIFWVDGNLRIGDNVGMSSVAIVCKHSISIGNNVTIGGNTVIYDTDFHSIDPKVRLSKLHDQKMASVKPVIISDNVFIGAHTTILKGVVIGENTVIGAGSVVTKSIPPNEIWAGNPAKFIRKI